MFDSLIREYGDSLDSLRDFANLVGPFLKQQGKQALQLSDTNVAINMLPLLLGINAVDPDAFSIDAETLEKARSKFEGDIKVTIDESNGRRSANIEIADITSEQSKQMTDTLRILKADEYKNELLYRSCLFNLTSTSEWFLSQLFHIYFDRYPQAAGLRDRSFTFEELQLFDTISDARQYALDGKIEDIMRGSLDDWLRALKERLGLSLGYLDSSLPRIVEVFQRRNLLAHNGGVVNRIYMSKVDKRLREGAELEQKIAISHHYMERAIDLLELNFTLIGVELWKKLDPADDRRGVALIETAYRHLSNSRWAVAEGLSYFLMNDKQQPESLRVSGQLNYWQSLKWQDRYEEVKSEIEAADFSAKGRLYRLALLALQEENEKFFKFAPEVLDAHDISFKDINEWPIFREMRDDPQYAEIRDKFGPRLLAEQEAADSPVTGT